MGSDTAISFRLIDALFRHMKLFLVCVITIVVLAGFAIMRFSRTYTAVALTRTTNDDVAEALDQTTKAPTYVSLAQQNANQFTDLLNDDTPNGFLATALKKAKLNRPISINPEDNDPRLALLIKRLNPSASSEKLFAISLVWDDPGECQRIVAALRDQYIQQIGNTRQKQSSDTAHFLENQIRADKVRMRQAEEALIKYKKNNSGRLPEAQDADIQQLQTLKSDYDYLKITSQDNSLKRRELEQRLAAVSPQSILEQTVADNPTLSEIKRLQAKRISLLADDFLPTSDDVVAIDEKLKKLQKLMKTSQDITETKFQDNPEYQLLAQQLSEARAAESTQKAQMMLMQQNIQRLEDRVRRIPAEQRELAEKTRDSDVLKKHYEELMQRREQALTKASLDQVRAQATLIPIGMVFAQPTTGKTKMLLMLIGVLVLGTIVGSVMILVSEWNDHSLRYKSDVERLLGLPILASIPESRDLLSVTGGQRQKGLPW